VKLSPLVTDIRVIAKAAEEAGADGLTVANTYPAMSIDVKARRFRLGCPTGGLSGPAIRPITLRLVWEAAKAVRIPVIGLGGIETVDDVLEYLSVGAAAVQVGTASFVRPGAVGALASELKRRATGFNVQNIQGLTEVLVPKLD
jgi:dihydroorotate dehydrogenase (NAD+) catalytic subunit